MILTSNFKIAGHLPQAVAISQGLPRGWRGRVYKPLAPPWSLVKEKDPLRFTAAYKVLVLNRLDPREVVKYLGGDNFILLCWEAPGEFCHRRVVANWLLDTMGISVEEFNPALPHHQAWVQEMQRRTG